MDSKISEYKIKKIDPKEFEIMGNNEFVYWFSAYKNLENLSIELKLLD